MAPVSDVGWGAGGRVRAFVVCLPSGVRYWTVRDPDLRAHRVADDFLRHLRFGRGCAEQPGLDQKLKVCAPAATVAGALPYARER